MRLPPALLAPVSALDPRQRRVFLWLTTAVLALLLLWAAQARAFWPQWPISDPDTWGYLHPALSKLSGGPFEHTYGRNFVYPGFLYLILRATADFRAIVVTQHALGLATGALLWTAWRQWRGWFAASSRLPAWADAVLGLGMVSFFVRSASVEHFETQIRPEAVFPFVAMLQICLLLAFLRAWFGPVHRPDRAAVLAGASLFAAALTYEVKPSFGFAAGVAALPILWALVSPWRQPWRPRARLLGAAVVAGLAALVLLVLPEHELARADLGSRLFLPETLLTIHAPIIRDVMDRDLQTGAAVPFPAEWFADAVHRFDHEVQVAASPEQRPWQALGLNPDYLMYNAGSTCKWLYDTRTPDEIITFCDYYYFRAWTHRPGPMLAKVARQLPVFYARRCPAFWQATKLKMERFYGKTMDAFGNQAYMMQMLSYRPSALYLNAVDKLQTSDVVFRVSPQMTALNADAAFGFLPLTLLFLAGLISVAFLPVRSRRPALGVPGGVLVLMNAVLFANCLTVAVVHSLDGERYSFNLLVYAVLCETAALAWLYELAWAWVAREPAPIPTAAPAAPIPFTLPS